MNAKPHNIHTDSMRDATQAVALTGADSDADANAICAILETCEIAIHLQPLVSLSHGGIIGYEALARGPEHSPVNRADALFGAAARAGLTPALETLCVAQALQQLTRIPVHMQLFVNAGPALVAEGTLGRLLQASPLRHHFHRLVIEITENEPFGDLTLLKQKIRDLHTLGICVALDDFGCGFSNLNAFKTLRPDIVKITLEMIRDTGPAAQAGMRLRNLCHLLARHGAQIVIEGVETREQARAIKECGAHWAQGFYFKRPRPAEQFSWNRNPEWKEEKRARMSGAHFS